MGSFSCAKCGASIDLMYANRHVCGAEGPAGGYANRPDGKSEMDGTVEQFRLPLQGKFCTACEGTGAMPNSKPGTACKQCHGTGVDLST
jgi:DnaJ-class molecular chaperone